MLASRSSPDSVKLLLDAKANIETLDNFGSTALLHTAHFQMRCVKVLVDAQANKNVIDIDGNDPFKIVLDNRDDGAKVEASLILFPSKIDQHTSMFVLTKMMHGKYVKYHTEKIVQRILENKNLNLSQFNFEDFYDKRTCYIFLKHVIDLHDPTRQFGRLNIMLMQTKTEKQAISLEEHEYRQELLEKFDKEIKTLNERLEKIQNERF